MHGAQNTGLNACILFAENAHAPMHARLCNGAETSLPWKLLRNYLESCALYVYIYIHIRSLARSRSRSTCVARCHPHVL